MITLEQLHSAARAFKENNPGRQFVVVLPPVEFEEFCDSIGVMRYLQVIKLDGTPCAVVSDGGFAAAFVVDREEYITDQSEIGNTMIRGVEVASC
jgi:hypothetical protein